jgi:N-acetyl sugar amidotransferase
MRFRCSRCLYWSDHPLGINFDEKGVCSGCRIHEEKDSLNWNERYVELIDLLHAVKTNSNYDCIIPISGGQDSFYIVHTAIKKLKLKPLLINFNRIFNSKQGLRNLATLRTIFDADFRQFSINPDIAKSVIRTSLSNLGTLNWLWIAGQTSLPVRMAIQLNIPIVLWGAHQGLEQVGMFSHLDNVEMTRRYRKEHDLLGVDEKDIFQFNPNFTERDIRSLEYPSDEELLESNVRGIYLGNYFRWDPVSQHEEMSRSYGYMGRREPRTYYNFDNPDCPNYFGIQDILKQVKFGYSKVSDQLTRDIRFGRISRENALEFENKFMDKRTAGIDKFAEWLGAPIEVMNAIILSHSKTFSGDIINGEWLSKSIDENRRKPSTGKFEFIDNDYDVIGKGL